MKTGNCERCGKKKKTSVYYSEIAKTYESVCNKCFEEHQKDYEE